MTTKQKAVYQYIRDKHTQEECSAYIEGWEDAYMEGFNASEEKGDSEFLWALIAGIAIGALITLFFIILLNISSPI
jgi:hypothetical protein